MRQSEKFDCPIKSFIFEIYKMTSSIFNKSTTYISKEQVKASSNISWLVNSSDSLITRRILEAEKIIDNFIIAYWQKSDSNQSLIFPTVDDDIPDDITEACLYIVESLYVQWDQLNNLQNQIVQESVADHTVKYSESKNIDSTDDLIPFKAKGLLEQYWWTFFQQTLHNNQAFNAQTVFTADL